MPTLKTDQGQPGSPAQQRTRGFEPVTGNDDFMPPTRSTRHSGAYDIYSPVHISLMPGETYILKTGVKAYMQPDEVLLVFMRSSMGKKDLELRNKVAVIDSDYYGNPDNDGNICLMLRNASMPSPTPEGDPSFITIMKGDKIAQGMFVKYLLADTDSLQGDHATRTGGIGSTGQ